jgi:hypothetical protein
VGYTTAIKRAFLRVCYSEKGEVALSSALEARIIAAANRIASGQTVSRTASLDVSVEFSAPGLGSPGTDGVVELWEDLRGDYDYAVTSLQNDGTSSPTDAQIYTRMLRDLTAVKRYGTDFSGMRMAIGGVR